MSLTWSNNFHLLEYFAIYSIVKNCFNVVNRCQYSTRCFNETSRSFCDIEKNLCFKKSELKWAVVKLADSENIKLNVC